VEDTAAVVLVSIVAIGTIQASERGRNITEKTAGAGRKVHWLKHAIDCVAKSLRGQARSSKGTALCLSVL